MENITIGFSKPKNWMPYAWIIMKGYGTPYDHVYISFYSDTADRTLVYQASKTMVNFIEFNNFKKDNEVVKDFNIQISDENRIKMIQFAIDNAGKPYGFWNAFGLGIVRLFDIFGYKIKNPFSDGERTYVCCELAAYILKDFTNIDINIDLDTINPKELYDLIEKKYG